jgi:hypothetical protein
MVMALVEVSTASREVLRSELSEYLVEFARMEGVPVQRAADGSHAYQWFDAYWVEDDRMPFFIEDAGEIVGFCLIRAIHGGWTIAEFGIRAQRRREASDVVQSSCWRSRREAQEPTTYARTLRAGMSGLCASGPRAALKKSGRQAASCRRVSCSTRANEVGRSSSPDPTHWRLKRRRPLFGDRSRAPAKTAPA